ncbi:FAR1-related sequence 10 [Tanacetum coccineum]
MEDEVLYWYKIPLKSLDVGLIPLVSESDYRRFLGYVEKHKVMDVYVEIVEKNEESKSGSDSASESDNDFEDEEHVVQEVEVIMGDFNFQVKDASTGTDGNMIPVAPMVNLTEDNIEVLDFDSLESDLEDVPENDRRDVANDLIRTHAVESRRNLHFLRNDPIRIRVVCNGVVPCKNVVTYKVPGPNVDNAVKGKIVNEDAEEDKITCPWLLYLSKGDKGKWFIKTFKDEHHCLQSRKIKYCTSTFLSKHITDLIIMNPNMPIKAIQEQMQKKFHVAVSRDKAFRAKAKAAVSLRGDVKIQYALLRDYVMELKRCNPDTTVKIDVYGEEDPESPTRLFRRIYVCLGALKRGFREGGRELLGLDGAFMRGQYPGQMLTAVGVDANNGIYPVAYGIVESENQYSWTWFLKCLGDDFDLYSNSNFTFITDRQKGLLPALEKLFPHAQHRYCVRHIYENMNQTWKGSEYKEMLWKCASSTTTVLFEKNMQELKDFNKKAYEWLKKIPAEHWSRAYFSGRAHCDLLINNICEVFNRQLLEARDSPIITALEHVREYLMKRIVVVQKIIEKCDGPLTPAVARVFDIIKEASSECIVDWNGADQYQEFDLALEKTESFFEIESLEEFGNNLDGWLKVINKHSLMKDDVMGSRKPGGADPTPTNKSSMSSISSSSQKIVELCRGSDTGMKALSITYLPLFGSVGRCLMLEVPADIAKDYDAYTGIYYSPTTDEKEVPLGKYIQIGKHAAARPIIKSEAFQTGVVLGVANPKTWAAIDEKLRKRPSKH